MLSVWLSEFNDLSVRAGYENHVPARQILSQCVPIAAHIRAWVAFPCPAVRQAFRRYNHFLFWDVVFPGWAQSDRVRTFLARLFSARLVSASASVDRFSRLSPGMEVIPIASPVCLAPSHWSLQMTIANRDACDMRHFD